jgi:probable rRNA maturation factor
MDDEPPYQIAIAQVSGTGNAEDEHLIRAVGHVLRSHGVRRAEISIALMDDAGIAALNESYLGHPGPTDVLTFDLREGADGLLIPEDQRDIEGEIVISVQTARRRAAELGHPPAAELALYAVHGTLHLLGYDDDDEERAARMHEREDDLLQELGVGRIFRAGAT